MDISIKSMNYYMTNWSGLTHSDLIGKPFRQLLPEEIYSQLVFELNTIKQRIKHNKITRSDEIRKIVEVLTFKSEYLTILNKRGWVIPTFIDSRVSISSTGELYLFVQFTPLKRTEPTIDLLVNETK